MPQGNDAAEAARELEEKLGVSPSADVLIQNVTAARDPNLAAAQLRPVDDEATNDLDLDDIDAGGDEVLDAKVRGTGANACIIFVAVDEDGRTYKGFKDIGGGSKKRKAGNRRATTQGNPDQVAADAGGDPQTGGGGGQAASSGQQQTQAPGGGNKPTKPAK